MLLIYFICFTIVLLNILGMEWSEYKSKGELIISYGDFLSYLCILLFSPLTVWVFIAYGVSEIGDFFFKISKKCNFSWSNTFMKIKKES